MTATHYKPHEVLLSELASSLETGTERSVLDLACGRGRSGLILANRNTPVVFADRAATALDNIRQTLLDRELPGRTWQIDLEQPGINPLDKQVFSAVVCFRYLYRPLFPYLMQAVEPGGLVVYETFTTDNRQFGRPTNPDYLLRPGELRELFQSWQILHYYEGIQHEPDRAIAQIVARKPDT
jgi:SAM-dependent methyltransferase